MNGYMKTLMLFQYSNICHSFNPELICCLNDLELFVFSGFCFFCFFVKYNQLVTGVISDHLVAVFMAIAAPELGNL